MSRELRILVIEDSSDKYKRVMELLVARLVNTDCKFSWAREYNSAVKSLHGSTFDLVILDLLIPIGEGRLSIENSRTLLSMMQSGELSPVPHVVGLTAHLSAAEEERSFYAAGMLALELFSFETEDWADRLAAKISYLFKAKLASTQFNDNNYETDILIVVARYRSEFRPIAKRMRWESPPTTKNSYFPTLKSESGRLAVAKDLYLKTTMLCIGETGIASAAVTASQAIGMLRPRLVAMLGMCCGFAHEQSSSPALLGDVLVAQASACWEEGKFIEAANGEERLFRNRSVFRAIDDTIAPAVALSIETTEESIAPLFTKFLRSQTALKLKALYGSRLRTPPDVKYGTIVSGSSVVADSAQTGEIIKRHRSAIGLEMELFGVYTAAQKSRGRSPSVIGIKGVADFGTGEKNDLVQEYASILSYYTFLGILKSIYASGRIAPIEV